MVTTARRICTLPLDKERREHLRLYEITKKRYEVASVFLFTVLLHKMQNNAQGNNTAININAAKSNEFIRLIFFNKTPILAEKLFNSNYINLDSFSDFLTTSESLHTLISALWRVYNSNNLRLSQSLFRLINSITERGFKLREVLPLRGFSRNTVYIQKVLTRYLQAIKNFSMQGNAEYSQLNMNSYYSSAFMQRNLVNPPLLKAYNVFNHTLSHEVNQGSNSYDNLFFEGGTILPILSRIYEGIESNYLFYNASSYQSVKTLYRMTNSLWKIYSGHNLELSRSFIQLISNATKRSKEPKNYAQGDIFSAASSLQYLVNALRRAFSGTNLHLRRSLISLVKDIRQAGDSLQTSSTHKELSQLTQKSYESILLLYRIFLPADTFSKEHLVHHKTDDSVLNAKNSEELKKYVSDKVKPSVASPSFNAEELIKTVIKRIRNEQSDLWRLEKMQRGLV